MTAVLSARACTVRRGRHTVLDRVDLDIAAGELVCLVGPNGAGKSTLLHTLAGGIRPVEGSIMLGGDDIRRLPKIEQARRRAVLAQENTVGFPFSCREIVAMGRHPWRGTPSAADNLDAVAAAMTACAVTEFAERPFTALSGGERARVALARVLAQDTGLLLLDEPTAAMDLRYQEAMMSLVRDRVRAGAAAVVVVHDLGLAAAYSDRVAVLSGNRIHAIGPAADTFTPELLSEVYALPIHSTVLDGHHIVLPRRDRPGDFAR